MQTENQSTSETSSQATDKSVADTTSENLAPTPSSQKTADVSRVTAGADTPAHGKNGGCCGGCGG